MLFRNWEKSVGGAALLEGTGNGKEVLHNDGIFMALRRVGEETVSLCIYEEGLHCKLLRHITCNGASHWLVHSQTHVHRRSRASVCTLTITTEC